MKVRIKSGWIGAALPGFAPVAPAYAQAPAPHAHGNPSARASSDMYEGLVRRVNKEKRGVTLTHGPLRAFDMPPMTMAFPVKYAKELASLKEGDKARFALEKAGEDLVITRAEAVKWPMAAPGLDSLLTPVKRKLRALPILPRRC